MKRTNNILKVNPDKPAAEDLQRAALLIQNGKLVAFPTETVYGLGANALDEKAVEGIFRAKGRPSDNPLIVHIADIKELKLVARDIPDVAKKLMKAFWPGPLTIVLHKQQKIPYIVTAGLETVAVRMPAHTVALALIKATGLPIAAPSANKSGKPSPTDAEHVVEDFSDTIDLILDGGKTNIGLESTVIDCTTDKVIILRKGQITDQMLKKVLGYLPENAKAKSKKVNSPGLKYRHYAPEIPLILFTQENEKSMITAIQKHITIQTKQNKRTGILCCFENRIHYPNANQIISPGSITNLDQIAKNLYSCLRQFKANNIDTILCENFGIGNKSDKNSNNKDDNGTIASAIQDRLTRAASEVVK